MLEMKKVRSKKLFGELVNELRPFMNDEGLEVLDYFGDPENINAFKLGELKEDLVKSIVPANFTNLEDFLDVAQNIGIKVEGLDTETVEKVEKTPKKETKKAKKEAKKPKKETKKAEKPAKKEVELTPAQIVELVGYRYTRPKFPEVLDTDMLGDYILKRVDTDSFTKLEEIGLDNLIVATFFSDKDTEAYVDPNFISDKSYKELLQEKGLQHFPNNLDLAQVYHIDANFNSMMYVSLITGIQYVASCKGKYAKVDKTLHSRMNTFGHDFAIYKAEAKKNTDGAFATLVEEMKHLFGYTVKPDVDKNNIKNSIFDDMKADLDEKEMLAGKENLNMFIRYQYVQSIDKKWLDHLETLESLREAVYLRSYGSKNPLTEYKIDGFNIFYDMLDSIRLEIAGRVFKVKVTNAAGQDMQRHGKQPITMNAQHNAMQSFDSVAARSAANASPMASRRQSENATVVRSTPKVGRNDPCPCGSGKKYKQCCGK